MSAGSVVPRPASLKFRDALYHGGPVVAALAAIIAIAVLWRQEVFPTNFVGEAQSPSSIISSPVDGRLIEVQAELFDEVSAGQVLAKVRAMGDETMDRSVAVLKADLEVTRLRMLQDQQRNDLNQFQAWRDLMSLRIELAGARIHLQQAESEFERQRVLYEQQLTPAGAGPDQDGYEIALRDRDLLRSEVTEKERLVAELQQWMERLNLSQGTNFVPQVEATIERATHAQEEQLLDVEGPNALRAATNGMVMKIYRHAGEQVTKGELLFEIQGTEPRWIFGYVRQPITYRPQVGDKIRVVSRGHPPRQAIATVQRVGAHLQSFTQPLRVRGFDSAQERGLPVLLDYPPSLELRPGEIVDLIPTKSP